MAVTIAQETISPERAASILSKNSHNRNVRTGLVSTLKRDIAADRWVLNGETIKISESGVLLDGQHRLLAVVEAKKPIVTMVVRGLDEDTQVTVDTGSRRGLRDVFKIEGVPHSDSLAATIRNSWFLEHYKAPRAYGVAPSVAELMTHFKKNPGLADTNVLGIQAARSSLKITGSIAGAVAYRQRQIDSKLADEFWRQLLENEAPPRSAIWALRESLTRDLGRPHRMDVIHRTAFVIKAWNLWLAGREAEFISWRGGGPKPEAFPAIKSPAVIEEEGVE